MKLFKTTYKTEILTTEEYELEFENDTEAEDGNVNIYPEVKYQTFHGFGGAVTEASAYAYSFLSEDDKKAFIEGYFGKDGLNYSHGRLHLDSCDFSLSNYSAKENADSEFSLERDEKYILPLLREIEKSKKLKYMMSPWSPPAYMKTNGEKNHGGKLKKEFYAEWASYMCTYIEEYIKMGFDISMLSIQNEPMATQTWDSCIYSAEEEAEFLSDYLYPEMKKRGLSDVKRLVWDHNRIRVYERFNDIVKAAGGTEGIDGYAYHWYCGDYFEHLQMLREIYPDMLSVFSEGCVEYSNYKKGDSWVHAEKYAYNILNCLKNGCNLFLDWNILLDNIGGPNHVGNYCDAPMMLDEENNLKKKPSYYMIGHFSKHINAGARRVAISSYTENLDYVAFENPNGEIVAVILNRQDREQKFVLRANGKSKELSLDAKSILTVKI